MQQDEPCPQESHSTQAEMESYKEQMKEMQKRIGSLFQSEQHIRDRLQKGERHIQVDKRQHPTILFSSCNRSGKNQTNMSV